MAHAKLLKSQPTNNKRTVIDISSGSESDTFIVIDSDVEIRQPKKRKIAGSFNRNEERGVKVGNGTFAKLGGFNVKDVEVVDLVDSDDGLASEKRKEQERKIKDLEQKRKEERRKITREQSKEVRKEQGRTPLGMNMAAVNSNMRRSASRDLGSSKPLGNAIYHVHNAKGMNYNEIIGNCSPDIQNPDTGIKNVDASDVVMKKATDRDGIKHLAAAKPIPSLKLDVGIAGSGELHSAPSDAARRPSEMAIAITKAEPVHVDMAGSTDNKVLDHQVNLAHNLAAGVGSNLKARKSISIPSFELADAQKSVVGTITVLRREDGDHYYRGVIDIMPWESHQLFYMINSGRISRSGTLVRISNKVYNVEIVEFAKEKHALTEQENVPPTIHNRSTFSIDQKMLTAAEELELMRSWVDAGIEIVSRELSTNDEVIFAGSVKVIGKAGHNVRQLPVDTLLRKEAGTRRTFPTGSISSAPFYRPSETQPPSSYTLPQNLTNPSLSQCLPTEATSYRPAQSAQNLYSQSLHNKPVRFSHYQPQAVAKPYPNERFDYIQPYLFPKKPKVVKLLHSNLALPEGQYLTWQELERRYCTVKEEEKLDEHSYIAKRRKWLSEFGFDYGAYREPARTEQKKQEVENKWASETPGKRRIVEAKVICMKYDGLIHTNKLPLRERPTMS